MKSRLLHHILFVFFVILILLAIFASHAFQTDTPGHYRFSDAAGFKFALVAIGIGAYLFIYIHFRLKNDIRITRRQLHLSEQRFKTAFDITGDAMWHYDIVTGQMDCNDCYYTMLGYEPHAFDATFDKILELTHPEDVNHLRRTIKDYIDGTIDMIRIDFRLKTKNGSWAWILSRGKAIEWDESGRALKLAGTHIDITEEKKAKALLQKSEERFRLVVENMDGYIFVICKEQIVFATPNLSEVIEPPYSLERLMDCIAGTVAETGGEHPTGESEKHLLNTLFYTDKIKIVLPDKRTQWIQVRSSHILWQGNSARLICWRDITETVDASKHQISLEKHLCETQRINALAAMADGISRHYKNHIQVVSGNIELALSTSSPNEENYTQLKKIETVLADSAALMDAFAFFSRNDESSQQIIDLDLLLKRLFETLRCFLPQNIILRYHPRSTNRIKAANPVQITQAIINLVLNARDAMPEGGHIIFYTYDVSGEATDAHAPKYVGLDIIDQGGGIDKDILAKIFDPFFTTKNDKEHSGLGLYTTHTIIHNNGGHIECRNVVCGARFKLWFPAEIPSEQLAQVISFPIGGNETILLVDDNRGINTTTSEYLRRYGYHVISAHCAEEALNIYERSFDKIHIVIVDLIMPGMGGRRCIRELFKINPKVKIIVASAYIDSGFLESNIATMVKKIIPKPYLGGGKILNTIRKVINLNL